MKKLKFLVILVIAFTILTTDANLPFYPIVFPRDNAAHYEKVPYTTNANMTEWWYYNGRLTTTTGEQFGYYFVIFRVQKKLLGIKFVLPFIQYQITDINKHKVIAAGFKRFKAKNSRFSTKKLALLAINRFSNFQLVQLNNTFHLNSYTKSHDPIAITRFNLNLTPLRHPFLIGKTGLIPMGNNANSYYYSITRLATSGSFTVAGKSYQLDSKKSISWMDHQWGGFSLSKKNQWIWMSIQLNNGMDLHFINAIDNKTKKNLGGLANVLLPTGKTFYTRNFLITPMGPFTQNAHSPLRYQIQIPPLKLQIIMTAMTPDQYQNGYWEGISSANGSYQNKKITGWGYTENTVKYSAK